MTTIIQICVTAFLVLAARLAVGAVGIDEGTVDLGYFLAAALFGFLMYVAWPLLRRRHVRKLCREADGRKPKISHYFIGE
jgi:hypothetical protein